MKIRPYQETDQTAVIQLWKDCQLVRSWNDPTKDILRKLNVQREMFLIGELDGTLEATIMAGYEGHRGWLNYLAVQPDLQRSGYGKQMVNAAEEMLRVAGCPKINLQVRSTNAEVIEFYKSIGYQIDEVISMGKRLEHDD